MSLLRLASARGDSIADDAVNSHVRSLMANHLFDVQSTDQHTVKPWFQGRLDFSPPVVDLARSGLPLAGAVSITGVAASGRARVSAPEAHHQRVRVAGEVVLPVLTDAFAGRDVDPVRGFHVRHWIHGGNSFWAVSDLNDAELLEFGRGARSLRAASFRLRLASNSSF